jgi:AraC-like DNA-binding protein
LTQPKPLKWTDAFHFLFFFLAVIINIPLILESGEEKLKIMTQEVSRTTQIFALLMPLVASVYAVLSYRLLMRHPLAVTARLSWLRVMLWLNMIIWVVVWISIIAPNYLHQLNNTVIYLLVSLVIYMLGYFSLRQPDIFVQGEISQLLNATATNKDAGPKYGDNRLPDELRESIWSALESYIQEHSVWRASNLTLTQLAESTGIASHHISQVLNDHHGLSFTDYLNQHRVNAVCAELQRPSAQNLLDIALACGFSSKSSFNAIFKKFTGKTPSEYRKQFQP